MKPSRIRSEGAAHGGASRRRGPRRACGRTRHRPGSRGCGSRTAITSRSRAGRGPSTMMRSDIATASGIEWVTMMMALSRVRAGMPDRQQLLVQGLAGELVERPERLVQQQDIRDPTSACGQARRAAACRRKAGADRRRRNPTRPTMRNRSIAERAFEPAHLAGSCASRSPPAIARSPAWSATAAAAASGTSGRPASAAAGPGAPARRSSACTPGDRHQAGDRLAGCSTCRIRSDPAGRRIRRCRWRATRRRRPRPRRTGCRTSSATDQPHRPAIGHGVRSTGSILACMFTRAARRW